MNLGIELRIIILVTLHCFLQICAYICTIFSLKLWCTCAESIRLNVLRLFVFEWEVGILVVVMSLVDTLLRSERGIRNSSLYVLSNDLSTFKTENARIFELYFGGIWVTSRQGYMALPYLLSRGICLRIVFL